MASRDSSVVPVASGSATRPGSTPPVAGAPVAGGGAEPLLPGLAPCPMVRFVQLISGKWAIPILYRLIVIDAPVRFSELQRAVAPITQKELTRQLRLFERRGLVQRQVYAEVPPRVEYQITALGRSLRPTLDALADWMRGDGRGLVED